MTAFQPVDNFVDKCVYNVKMGYFYMERTIKCDILGFSPSLPISVNFETPLSTKKENIFLIF
jgi:hypothetical protein